ncbi:hypothetical protein Pfra02_45480 [Pseudomonas fragi]|nr:hypothetical protein Pfra02_45480 [Pseudomonas fragi]
MKGFGTFALIVGICWVVFALSMDISVSTGMGRVNNLGLMADRQVHAIVGGMIALAGLVMLIFGGKVSASAPSALAEVDTRPCPLCAETIKNAAIKCKHCGAEVEAMSAPILVNGWVASIPCTAGERQDRARQFITDLGMPAVPMIGSAIGAGPFATKEEAKRAMVLLRDERQTFSEIAYRDSVSGKFKPVGDTATTLWALAIPCRKESDREQAIATAGLLGLTSLSASDSFVRFGPFTSKLEAGEIWRQLTEKGVHGNIEEIRES